MNKKCKQLLVAVCIFVIFAFGCSKSEIPDSASDFEQSSSLEENNDEQSVKSDIVTNDDSNLSSEQKDISSKEENIDSVSNSDEMIVDKVPGVKHQFLEKLDAIQEELESMPLKADSDKGVTNAMRSYYGIAYEKYDEAINEIYQFLMKNLSEETAKQLQSDQIQWIIHKEALAEEEKAKYNGGTYEFVAFFVSLYESTKTRCYELVDLYMD